MAGLNMQIEEVRIDEISNHPTNPKIHPDTQIKLLQKSIKRFGWTNPVILSADNTILAGHARVKAAIAAGNDTVPCIRTKLTGKEADAYLLADNRLSDIAPYDRDILAELLSDLPDDLAELTGFDSVQVEALLSGEEIPDIDRFISDSQPEEPREEVDAEPQIDRAAELNEIWQVKTGDMWQLGDHRLICGDCTDPAVVERVMMGEKAIGCITSPPYAEQRKEQYGGIPVDKYSEWFETVQSNIKNHIGETGSFFLNIKPHVENGQRSLYVFDLVKSLVSDHNWLFIEEYIWKHPGTPKAPRRRFKNQFEPVYQFALSTEFLFFPDNVKIESDRCFSGDGRSIHKNQGKTPCIDESVEMRSGLAYPGNVVSVNFDKSNGHAAPYPVGLPTFFIKAYSKEKDIWYDPFLGSGTTLIACENTGRKCRGIEISPEYCAVILQRFKDATGKEPVRING